MSSSVRGRFPCRITSRSMWTGSNRRSSPARVRHSRTWQSSRCSSRRTRIWRITAAWCVISTRSVSGTIRHRSRAPSARPVHSRVLRNMSSNAELHLAYKVGNAELSLFPYPHFFVQNVFPSDFYAEIQANLPDPAALLPIAEVRPVKGYKERYVFDFAGPQFNALPREKQAFWSGMHKWLLGGRFGQLVIEKFRPFIAQRFGNDPNLELYDEGLLVQDITNYSLGPHTDSPRKVITFLFYLPRDDSQRHLGTSI